MNSAEQIKNNLKRLKPILKEKFYVREIGYFGSSKGTFGSKSDVDILVEFSKPMGWEFLDLQFFLEEKLGRSVDLVTKNALKKQIKHSILSQVQYF